MRANNHTHDLHSHDVMHFFHMPASMIRHLRDATAKIRDVTLCLFSVLCFHFAVFCVFAKTCPACPCAWWWCDGPMRRAARLVRLWLSGAVEPVSVSTIVWGRISYHLTLSLCGPATVWPALCLPSGAPRGHCDAWRGRGRHPRARDTTRHAAVLAAVAALSTLRALVGREHMRTWSHWFGTLYVELTSHMPGIGASVFGFRVRRFRKQETRVTELRKYRRWNEKTMFPFSFLAFR